MNNAFAGFDFGILILRLTVGFTFFYHGTQKLFSWFGCGGLTKTGAIFESIGFVPGKRNSVMAGLAEGGGLLLWCRIATRDA